MTLASEDAFRNPVDQADLEDWADYFSLTFPVLEDPGAVTDLIYDPMRRTRPGYVLLAPGGVIVEIGNSISNGDIEAVLPTAYP